MLSSSSKIQQLAETVWSEERETDASAMHIRKEVKPVLESAVVALSHRAKVAEMSLAAADFPQTLDTLTSAEDSLRQHMRLVRRRLMFPPGCPEPQTAALWRKR